MFQQTTRDTTDESSTQCTKSDLPAVASADSTEQLSKLAVIGMVAFYGTYVLIAVSILISFIGGLVA